MPLKPLISIIIPVYNTEKYISRCIDSILSQLYRNFELLLIDDGTPDRAGDICDDYARIDSRIKVFHKKNGGASSARNVGLENATGEWIAFADSDDWVKESWLLDYVSEIERYPNIGLVYQGFITLKDGVEHVGKTMEDRLFSERELSVAYKYLDGEVDLFGYTCSKIYRTDVFKQYNFRFDQRLSFCEDLELTLRFVQKIDSIAVINRFNYIYNHDSGVSLARRYHSYDALNSIADMVNTQLELLNRRTSGVVDNMFDTVIHYRFRALKSLYRPTVSRSAMERRRIIDLYLRCYYRELSMANIYNGAEKYIVKVLALRNVRLIDLIYRILFKIKA